VRVIAGDFAALTYSEILGGDPLEWFEVAD
jgi:hypothetical protein